MPRLLQGQQAEQPQALRGAAAALGDDEDDDMELQLEHPEGKQDLRSVFWSAGKETGRWEVDDDMELQLEHPEGKICCSNRIAVGLSWRDQQCLATKWSCSWSAPKANEGWQSCGWQSSACCMLTRCFGLLCCFRCRDGC